MDNNDFSDVFEDEDEYLEHYGVKGMKWGVWNEETKAKYNGGLGRASNAMKAKLSQAGSAVGSGAKAIKRFTGKSVASAKAQVATMAGNSKAKREAKKEEKKDVAAQRKELGMTRVEYNKLRDQTLKSHDPNVIAKGMHTLTDDELASKISRLNEENKISKMASERTNQMYDAKKKRNEALNANPLVKVGKEVLSDAGKNYANGLVDKMLGKGVAEKAEKAAKDASEKAKKQNQQENSKQESSKQETPTIDMSSHTKSEVASNTSKYNFGKNTASKTEQSRDIQRVMANVYAQKLTSGQSVTHNKGKQYFGNSALNTMTISKANKLEKPSKPTKEEKASNAKNYK